METETTPTQAQRLWVYALEGLYNDTDLAPSERKRAEHIVASKQISLTEKDDFSIVASYLLAERGRWQTLQTIYGNFDQQRDAGGQLDEWYFVTMAEFAEIQRLLRNEEFDTAIVRGCSFTEHFIDDNVEWFRYAPFDFGPDDEPSVAQLINFARKEGFIDERVLKLQHFVREVRNHTAHHAWLTTELDIDIVVLAGRAQLYVLDQLLDEKATRDDIDFPEFGVEQERVDGYLTTITDDFGWTFNERQKYWMSPRNS